MTEEVYEDSFLFDELKIEKYWNKLQLRETFVSGQLPPYNVEFETGKIKGTFEEGELNIHHGPFLSVHGAIGKVTNDYRDLKYFYGSYFLSFRLVRPVRLEFFKEKNLIKLKLSYFIKPWFKKIWNPINKFFWKSFPRLLK